MSAADPLAARLRALRQSRWDIPVTQPVLGQALGIKPPTISSWERTEAPSTPSEDRVAQYATFFATRRSVVEGRLLSDEELTPQERSDRDALLVDLLRLRAAALIAGAAADDEHDFWRFPDGAPVRIIVGLLRDRPGTAAGTHPNYMAMSAYADQDALVELFGHVRAQNPQSDVRFELAGRLEGDDLHAHLVLVGNLARQQSDVRHWMPQLRIRQVPEEGLAGGEVFEVGERGSGVRYGPAFVGEGKDARLIEDVGYLARTPSPLDSARTLTVCSGVFTRGGYGAVRSLTDRDLRVDNARYLRERFAGESTFAILMRVLVTDHAVGTPKLSDARVRLHEFP